MSRPRQRTKPNRDPGPRFRISWIAPIDRDEALEPMARNVICFVCVPPMVLPSQKTAQQRASLAITASRFSFSGGLYPRAKLI
jgi:hypothetical protein